MNDDTCSEIKELLKIELEIIKKHIDEHKWFNHIADKDEAINDFINKYAWLMKEVYCNAACKKENCELRKTIYKLSDLQDK